MSFGPILSTLGLVAVLSLITPSLAACAPRDEVLWTDGEDAVMKAATAEALKSLPDFWAKYDAHEPTRSNFYVKVGLPTDHGGVEHVWVEVLSHSGEAIMGRLDNDPEDVRAMKAGAEFRVDPAKISDWMYAKDEKFYGAFTTRAMAPRISAAQRKEAEAMLAPTPLEPAVH